MIVISGALVLVALVLLVIGLIDPSLGFVYASIAVSLASFGFLVVGILQRRKEDLPVTEDVVPALAEGITAIIPAASPAVSTVQRDAAVPPVAGGVTGQVLVVAGRPRYHVEGCRYLIGKDAASIDVGDARDEGFTACGVCKPDQALEVAAIEPEPVIEPLPVRAARAATTTRAAAAKAPVATVTVPVKKTAPIKAAATKTATKAAATKAAPINAAPITRAAAKAPAKAAAAGKTAAPVKRGGVIVIPDRGKYHTPDCRYVRGAEGTVELTKASATRQGYEACGVCNP